MREDRIVIYYPVEEQVSVGGLHRGGALHAAIATWGGGQKTMEAEKTQNPPWPLCSRHCTALHRSKGRREAAKPSGCGCQLSWLTSRPMQCPVSSPRSVPPWPARRRVRRDMHACTRFVFLCCVALLVGARRRRPAPTARFSGGLSPLDWLASSASTLACRLCSLAFLSESYVGLITVIC